MELYQKGEYKIKKLLLVIALLVVVVLSGCYPSYVIEENTMMNLVPEQKYYVEIDYRTNGIAITVKQFDDIIYLDESFLRNVETHEGYVNYGNIETLVYTDLENGNYKFGGRYGEREIYREFSYER